MNWFRYWFIFPFLKTHYAWDIGSEFTTIVGVKIWRNKFYVVKEKSFKTSESISKLGHKI